MRLCVFAIAVLAASALSMSSKAQTRNSGLERCQLLLATFDRYYSKKDSGLGSTGSRLDRDIAEAQCERGDVAVGIRGIEDTMRRNSIPIPPG